MAAMCTDAYREALTRALSSTASPAPAPAVARDAMAVNGESLDGPAGPESAGGPKCRHDHRLKQQPGWKVDQLPDGTFRWTTPSGRSYDTEPTRYPT